MSTVSDMDRNFWPVARTDADLEYDGGLRDLAAAFVVVFCSWGAAFSRDKHTLGQANFPWWQIRLSLAGEGVR